MASTHRTHPGPRVGMTLGSEERLSRGGAALVVMALSAASWAAVIGGVVAVQAVF
jgi:hypothetical protein